MYWLLLSTISTDVVVDYLVPRFGPIWTVGPITAFTRPFGDATPPSLYLLAVATFAASLAHPVILIKLLCIAGNALLAAAMWRLLAALDTPMAGRKALVIIALPSVVLDAGLLAQCDALWAAACVMALAAAVCRRHAAMLAWCGLAVAIQLQPAFSAPLIIALLIGRRVPARLWSIAPLAFVAAMLPALLVGWPPGDIVAIYLRQADWSPALAVDAPNVWTILQATPLIGDLPLTGLALAAAIGASAWLIALFVQRPPEREQLIAAALLVTLVTVGLLPRMHERSFFLADVLAFALALSKAGPRSWLVAGLVQMGSILALTGYPSGLTLLPLGGAGAMIAATALIAKPFFTSPANDNGLPLNPLTMYSG